MLIRKNNVSPISEYHKTIRQTEFDEGSLIQSNLSAEALEQRTFDVEDLVDKIREQESQIEKLLGIIDKYKNKIEEFEQYEEVIKDFLARKQKQKTQIQPNSIPTSKIHPSFDPIIKPNNQALQKIKKQCIFPSYSITILCQNQRVHKQKREQQKFQIQKKNSDCFESQNSRKDDQKQNKLYRTNYKQKFIKEPLMRAKKNLFKSNSTFDISYTVPYQDGSEFRDENKVSFVQRVPSLSNMRRIEKCLKLLKS